ncbi:CHAP domain-containing protein [Streptosporangium sp. V21-05]|uniref:CHAP domain-containing protein n=1 Tax=Streptosporangium sp. V21-05 TaxID=3446115 RepID=UPI003F53BF94
MHKFIELLESQLGYSEKSGGYTKFGDWYGKNVEFDADYTAAPWCDMYLSWAAEKLGYQDWVGQFAYTVHHAQWFRQQDAWGTVPKPGAVVFFDWSGSNRIDHIDHVGIVTGVEGGRIHTIEGNIDGGIAKRKERDTGKVVGYGYPEKIKARLDRESTEKQTIVKPAAAGDNAVVIGPGADLLALLPAPVPARETRTSTGPGKAKPAPRHSAGTTTTGETGKDGKAVSGNDGRTASGQNPAASAPRGDRATAGAPAGAQAPASAGRTSPDKSGEPGRTDKQGKQGKHAKASTADTSALAVTPAATVRDLATPVPGLDSPAVLAPVLLAAVAILAHGKARQSRVSRARLLATTSGHTAPAPSPASSSRETPAPSPSPSPRRTPGRRRAPGRRRMPRNAPAGALSYAPAPARALGNTSSSYAPLSAGPLGNASIRDLPHSPAPAGTLGNTPVSSDLVETPARTHGLGHIPAHDRSYAPADVPENAPASPDVTDVFTAGAGFPGLGDAPVPPRRSTAPREPVPASTGFPSVTTPVAHVEEPRVPDRGDDRPRAPYRGRRRLREQAVVESSTWVRNAPPRGRRHRRADSVITTTVPATPATPARPTRPARLGAPSRFDASARPVAGPGTAVPVSAARTGRGDPAHPAGSAASPASPASPAEPGDILVHSGYRGRRRAEALV